MLQKLMYHVVPALLPFALYAVYAFAVRRGRVEAQARGGVFDDAPWYWLTVSALVVLIVSLLVFWFVNNQAAGPAIGMTAFATPAMA